MSTMVGTGYFCRKIAVLRLFGSRQIQLLQALFRICLDPKVLNKAILWENYPMPTMEDITTRLHCAKVKWQLQVSKHMMFSLSTFSAIYLNPSFD